MIDLSTKELKILRTRGIVYLPDRSNSVVGDHAPKGYFCFFDNPSEVTNVDLIAFSGSCYANETPYFLNKEIGISNLEARMECYRQVFEIVKTYSQQGRKNQEAEIQMEVEECSLFEAEVASVLIYSCLYLLNEPQLLFWKRKNWYDARKLQSVDPKIPTNFIERNEWIYLKKDFSSLCRIKQLVRSILDTISDCQKNSEEIRMKKQLEEKENSLLDLLKEQILFYLKSNEDKRKFLMPDKHLFTPFKVPSHRSPNFLIDDSTQKQDYQKDGSSSVSIIMDVNFIEKDSNKSKHLLRSISAHVRKEDFAEIESRLFYEDRTMLKIEAKYLIPVKTILSRSLLWTFSSHQELIEYVSSLINLRSNEETIQEYFKIDMIIVYILFTQTRAFWKKFYHDFDELKSRVGKLLQSEKESTIKILQEWEDRKFIACQICETKSFQLMRSLYCAKCAYHKHCLLSLFKIDPNKLMVCPICKTNIYDKQKKLMTYLDRVYVEENISLISVNDD
jgi:hypothetical protein